MAAGWSAWVWLVLLMGANWGCAWAGESAEGMRRLMRKGPLVADKDVDTVHPSPEEYKYVASLRVPEMLEGSPAPRDIAGQHYCAGVLIASNVVLTAGHCVQNSLKNPDVHVGRYRRNNRDTENFEEYSVLETVVHPDFQKRSDGSIEFDAALLILSDSSQFQPASLQRDLSGSAKGRVLGWGWRKEGNFQSGTKKLLAVDVEILQEDICQMQFEDANSAALCASESSDGCQIDSGGPLISDNVVKGVASSSAGCGRNRIGIYTQVLMIVEWIDEIVGEYADSLPPAPPPHLSIYSPSGEEYSASAGGYSASAGEYSASAGDYSDSAGEYSPSAGGYSPSAEEYSLYDYSLTEYDLFFPEEEASWSTYEIPEDEFLTPEDESDVYPKIPPNFGETQTVPTCQFWNGHWVPPGCPGG